MDAHCIYRPAFAEFIDEGYPVHPYGFKENPYSILDVADIVFVNPVNADLFVLPIKMFPAPNFSVYGPISNTWQNG